MAYLIAVSREAPHNQTSSQINNLPAIQPIVYQQGVSSSKKIIYGALGLVTAVALWALTFVATFYLLGFALSLLFPKTHCLIRLLDWFACTFLLSFAGTNLLLVYPITKLTGPFFIKAFRGTKSTPKENLTLFSSTFPI